MMIFWTKIEILLVVNVLDTYDIFYKIIDKKYSENCADLNVLFANKWCSEIAYAQLSHLGMHCSKIFRLHNWLEKFCISYCWNVLLWESLLIILEKIENLQIHQNHICYYKTAMQNFESFWRLKMYFVPFLILFFNCMDPSCNTFPSWADC